MKRYAINDWVIYHQQVVSTTPSPAARAVWPAERGDNYSYTIDRLWRVVRVDPEGAIEAQSEKGTLHRVRADDPLLEKASWWQRLARRHLIARPQP